MIYEVRRSATNRSVAGNGAAARPGASSKSLALHTISAYGDLIKLTGTPEEQADQLYELAEEAMGEGRYTAAYRYWQDIDKVLPGYRDVPERLAELNLARREQRFLIMGAFAGRCGARLSGPFVGALNVNWCCLDPLLWDCWSAG